MTTENRVRQGPFSAAQSDHLLGLIGLPSFPPHCSLTWPPPLLPGSRTVLWTSVTRTRQWLTAGLSVSQELSQEQKKKSNKAGCWQGGDIPEGSWCGNVFLFALSFSSAGPLLPAAPDLTLTIHPCPVIERWCHRGLKLMGFQVCWFFFFF
jgi:hypothetical protein